MSVIYCLTFHPLCKLSGYTGPGTALGLTLIMDIPITGPGVSQTLLLQGHKNRSTEVRSQDCSNHESGLMGVIEAAQIWPGPIPLYMGSQSLQLLKLGQSSIQTFYRCCFYQVSVNLFSFKESFQLFFLNSMAPETQLWSPLVCTNKDKVRRWHDCRGRGSPGSGKCMGKSVAIRDPALLMVKHIQESWWPLV